MTARDRAAEVTRIVRTLVEPSAKLLVVGERRMGKTSTLLTAIERVRARGGKAFLVDLSTASSFADAATRVIKAAARALGPDWRDLADVIARHVKATLTVKTDPGTGLVMPSLHIEAQRAGRDEQQRTLGEVLDALEDLARRQQTTIGVVLDEVQELSALGGTQAEWHLRGVMQHHQHLAYVLAGSRPTMLKEMTGEGRAFYGMLDVMPFGPIEAVHLATWIDARLESAGISARGIGAECVALAGPRTRDIVQLARKVYDVATTEGSLDERLVPLAFEELIDDMEEGLRAQWEEASALQRDVLRAVAAGRAGLTTRETRNAFGLPATGSVSKTVATLLAQRRLVRSDSAAVGYAFDNPYFRGWIARNTLSDTMLPAANTASPEDAQTTIDTAA